MHVSYILILVTSCWAYCVTAERYTVPRTVDELHNVLTALGVDVAGRLPVPSRSQLQSNATASTSHYSAAVRILPRQDARSLCTRD